jgi:hypothetical protein
VIDAIVKGLNWLDDAKPRLLFAAVVSIVATLALTDHVVAWGARAGMPATTAILLALGSGALMVLLALVPIAFGLRKFRACRRRRKIADSRFEAGRRYVEEMVARYEALSTSEVEVLRLYAQRGVDTLTMGTLHAKLVSNFPDESPSRVVDALEAQRWLSRHRRAGAWEMSEVTMRRSRFVELMANPRLVGLNQAPRRVPLL